MSDMGKSDAYKHKKCCRGILVLGLPAIWILIAILGVFLVFRRLCDFYRLDICFLDLMRKFQDSVSMGIVIVPAAALANWAIHVKTYHAQSIVRLRTRKEIFDNMMKSSALFAVYLAVVQIAGTFLIAGIFSIPANNWFSDSSFFYAETFSVVHIETGWVFLFACYCLFMKYLLIFILQDICSWNRLGSIWCMLLFIGIGVVESRCQVPVFFDLINIRYGFVKNAQWYLLTVALCSIGAFIMIQAGRSFFEHRDYFQK